MEVRFSAHNQIGTETNPASYIMGTESFLGLKQLGNGDNPPASTVEANKRVELYLCSCSVPT
jgi:hypothetical protein